MSISRKVFVVYICLFGIISSIYFPLLRTYGDIDYNLILSLSQTDTNESLSYLKVLEIKLIAYLICFWILIILTTRLSKNFIIIKKIKIYSLIIIPIIIIPIQLYHWNTGKHNSFLKKQFINNDIVETGNIFPTFNFLYKLISKSSEVYNFLDGYEKFKSSYNYKWALQKKKELSKYNVIIIGESESKQMRDIFNQQYPNNFIHTSNNIEFNKYYSASSITINSLTNTLIYSNAQEQFKHLNISSLLRSLGVQSFWLSNQGKIGRHDSPISAIALGFDSCIFIKQNDFISKNIPDDSLLVPFQHIIELNKLNNNPVGIVLHIVGSHPPFNVSEHTKPIDNYIATIRNTDKFINKVYDILTESHSTFNLFYFSDHGLSKTENGNFIHGSNYIENYHVPFAVWSNDITQKKFINAPRTAFDFLNIFSEINQLVIFEKSFRHSEFKRTSDSLLLDSIIVLEKNNNTLNLLEIIHNEY